jgi:hypothetical protein
MKRPLANIIILPGLLLLLGAEEPKAAPDYFPLRKGSVWTYETKAGGSDREIKKTVSAVEKVGGRECYLVDDPGFPGLFTKIHFQKTADAIRLVKARFEMKEPVTWLELPLEKDASWEGRLITVDGLDGGTVKFAVEAEKEKVKVEAGEFETFRVKLVGETAGGPTLEAVIWLAPDVGEVQRELKLIRDGKVISETRMRLKEYKPGKE